MAILLITYNLNGDDDSYDDLFKAIKAMGKTWHDAGSLESVWFVKTDKTPKEAHEAIASAMDKNDRDFIVDITGQNRYGLMPQSLWTWLEE